MMYKPLDIVREVHSVHLLMMTVRNSTGIFYINLSHTHTYTHTHTHTEELSAPRELTEEPMGMENVVSNFNSDIKIFLILYLIHRQPY